MPVFISHRTKDDELAETVYQRLRLVHGITCYIDNFDIEPSTSAITSRIVGRITACSTLLAIVTTNTQGSWWVPFEIGVARQAPRMISSFTNMTISELPEYLREWPILTGPNAVDIFAFHYKQRGGTTMLTERSASAATPRTDIDAFHRELKTRLGQ